MRVTKELADFAGRYVEMRLIQRAYFRNRSPQILEQAKTLERALDDLADEVMRTKPEEDPDQLALFPEPKQSPPSALARIM